MVTNLFFLDDNFVMMLPEDIMSSNLTPMLGLYAVVNSVKVRKPTSLVKSMKSALAAAMSNYS